MDPTSYISRIGSILVAVFVVVIAVIQGTEPGELVLFALLLCIPLVLIWFPMLLGGLLGSVRGSYVDKPSPGCLVAAIGWLMLILLPLIAWFVD